ncbi:MAG: RtcB family protein, partial [Phycisphaerae bacterium]|nr:RtcB family protein [Saprospiraceae bacterium]
MKIIEGVPVWGDPIDEGALKQILNCSKTAERVAMMADHHLGYAVPIGGVVAYSDSISPSGVGYDIACGNKAVLTDLRAEDIQKDISRLMDLIWNNLSFGLGRRNDTTTVEHELFDDAAWKISAVSPLKQMARQQLGTIGSGNHYVDLFSDEQGRLWIGVHFGSRGLGHKTATYFLKAGGAKDGMNVDPLVIPVKSALGSDYGLFVNGKSTKLKGVCLHQDAGSFGNAGPIEIWAYRLGLLKEMGCNAIRPSHHPFAPEFYDLCDQLGFYIFDEAFDEWTRDWTLNFTENTRGKAKYGYHLYFNQWYETDLRAMLRRDRNHPSVILYSIGNEIPDQFNNDGYKLAKKLMDICHEEDSTRPATSACDQSFVSSRNGFMDQLDIAGYNYIDRLYGDSTYVPERRRFPNRVFLGTETGHQLHYWLGVRDNDYVIGDFIWT